MPARIAVRLVSAVERCQVPPPQTGPAVQAALLKLIGAGGASTLAAGIHDARPPLPYAITPLLDERDRSANANSAEVRFEIGILADSMIAPILATLAEGATVRVARCYYRVGAVEVVSAVPYAEFVGEPGSSWTLRFNTPVMFATAREDGVRRSRVFPEPEWIFDSLYSRWCAFAAPLAEDVRVAVHRHMEVVDHRLTLAEHMVKAGQPTRRGSVGQVTYRLAAAHDVTAEARAGLDALARYAEYAGVGDRTAVGMGYTRLVADPHLRAAAAKRLTSSAPI